MERSSITPVINSGPRVRVVFDIPGKYVIPGEKTPVPPHFRVVGEYDTGQRCAGREGIGADGKYLQPVLRCSSCDMFWL